MTTEQIIAEVERVPGLTVSMLELDRIPWKMGYPIEQHIALETNRDLEYDKHGNPVFMPKDEAQKQEIREVWKRIDGYL